MIGQHRKRQAPSIRSTAVLIFAAALSVTSLADTACSQQGTPDNPAKMTEPEVAQRGQRASREIRYGNWRKLCFKAAGTKMVCRTTIAGTFETGQTAVRVDLIERDDGAARLQLFLPVGLYLQAGVKLSIDQGNPHRIPYVWCLTNACVAGDVVTPETIRELEAGQRLQLEVVDSNLQTVTTSLSLDQFGAVRNNAPAQMFDQAIDE